MMKNLGFFLLTIALINSIIESKKDSYKLNKHFSVSIDKSTQTNWNNKVQKFQNYNQQQQQLKGKHNLTKVVKRMF